MNKNLFRLVSHFIENKRLEAKYPLSDYLNYVNNERPE